MKHRLRPKCALEDHIVIKTLGYFTKFSLLSYLGTNFLIIMPEDQCFIDKIELRGYTHITEITVSSSKQYLLCQKKQNLFKNLNSRISHSDIQYIRTIYACLGKIGVNSYMRVLTV